MTRIRQALITDLDKIYKLEQECFISPWTMELLLLDIFGSEFNVYYVIEDEDGVFGYIGLNTILDEAHIRKLCIAEEKRREGHATALLQFAEKKMAENGMYALTLEVREHNQPAIRLYESFGFTPEGIRKDYYGNGEGAVIMWKRDIQCRKS